MNAVTQKSVMLNTKDLRLDTAYQRQLDPKRVARIVKNFDPLLVNPIKVSFRDGRYYIFDGQHTVASIRQKHNGSHVNVLCTVFYGLTQADEAYYFCKQNGISAAVSTNDKFRAEFNFGDQDVIGMVKSAEVVGVRVDFTKGQAANKVTALNTLFKCWKALERDQYMDMLSTIKAAWGGDVDAYRREILYGMCHFYGAYWGKFKGKDLAKSLSKITPATIVREGKSFGASAASSAYARVILRYYNMNRRSGRLEDTL